MLEPKLNQLIDKLENGKSIADRRTAALELSRLNNPDSIGPLMRSLSDHEDVVIFSTFSLVKIGKQVVPHLIRDGLKSENDQVRGYSVEILGELLAEEALSEIISISQNDPNPWVRQNAIEALGRINHPDSTQALKTIQNQEDKLLAIYATLALYRKGVKAGLAQFLMGMIGQVEESTAGLLAWALVEICDTSHQKELSKAISNCKNPRIKEILNDVISGIHMK